MMLINAYQFSSPAVVSRLVFPLTYDEKDSDDTITLTRSGGQGPHVTPAGFEGDGYSASYVYSSLPSWVNSGPLTLQASIKAPAVRNGAARTEMVSVCDASAVARLGLSVITDPRDADTGVVAARAYTGSVVSQMLGRPGWRYEFRTPSILLGGLVPKPQGALFLDADTILFTVHVDETQSIVYKINLADGAVLAQFSFGTTTNRHIATVARRSNGDIWFSEYETGKLLRVDLTASFSSGTASILQTVDSSSLGIGDAGGVGSIEFATLGGTEYLLVSMYSASVDTTGWLYLFPVTLLSGSSIAAANRYKRFLLGRRQQGIAMRNGNLLVSRNGLYGVATASQWGHLQELNLAGMASALADGVTVNASTNAAYILNTYTGPAAYPEDVAVHPTTNKVYVPTEGGTAVADSVGYLALWSGDFTPAGELNHYTLEYDGAGAVALKINNQLFDTMSWALSGSATTIAIGGLPSAAAGMATGFTWATIANVAVQAGPLSSSDYAAIIGGSFETSVLTTYTLTLTNPGAETGDTSGWTVESGGMTTRAASPLPFAGAWYFTGGSFVTSVSRQRLDLVAQGISAADLDSGALWAKIKWQQAAYDNNDPGGMGVRMLNAAAGTISTNYSAAAYVLGGGGAAGPWYWYPRSYPVIIPTLTRSLDALYNASGRTSGTANDHYVDSIEVKVYKQ